MKRVEILVTCLNPIFGVKQDADRRNVLCLECAGDRKNRPAA